MYPYGRSWALARGVPYVHVTRNRITGARRQEAVFSALLVALARERMARETPSTRPYSVQRAWEDVASTRRGAAVAYVEEADRLYETASRHYDRFTAMRTASIPEPADPAYLDAMHAVYRNYASLCELAHARYCRALGVLGGQVSYQVFPPAVGLPEGLRDYTRKVVEHAEIAASILHYALEPVPVEYNHPLG